MHYSIYLCICFNIVSDGRCTKNISYQAKKEQVSLEEKDEFDTLVDSNTKSLDDRLGNSPEKIEKKVAAKKGHSALILLNCYIS